MSRIKNPQDFWAGLLFLVIGIGAAWIAQNYNFGTAFKMGPGYLPTVLSWILAGLGVLMILRALFESGPKIEPSLYRPQFFILLAIVVFALLIERIGLAPTVVIATCIAALASTETRWLETAALAIGLAVLCSVLFVKLLGQPLEIFAWGF